MGSPGFTVAYTLSTHGSARIFNDAHCFPIETDSPEDAVRLTVKQFGRLDSLVSNDLVPHQSVPTEMIGTTSFRETIERLTIVPFRLATAAIAPMREQGKGQIVFVTSGSGGRVPVTPTSLGHVPISYIVAREATNSLARSLAVELAPDEISVNAVAPFYIEKGESGSSADPDSSELAQLVATRVPQKRFGTQNELAPLIALLASGRSSYISGQVIAFSGAGS